MAPKKDPTKTYTQMLKKNLEESIIVCPSAWDINRITLMNPRPPKKYSLIKFRKENTPA